MKKRSQTTNLPYVIEHFDKLPSDARLDSKAIRILFGINSYATFSRRRKDGTIPDPDCSHGTWSVQAIRNALKSSHRKICGEAYE
jgi:hypothetical protein